MIKIIGESIKVSLKFIGYTYDECDQITINVYNKKNTKYRLIFVKVLDDKYENEKLIEVDTDDNSIVYLNINSDLSRQLIEGEYFVEIERKIENETIKNKSKVFELVDTTL